AMNVSAFRNEITLCEQARALFPQKPLDRFGSRLMRTNVNVAELFRHAPINSPALEGNSNFARGNINPRPFFAGCIRSPDPPESPVAMLHFSAPRRETRADRTCRRVPAGHGRVIAGF